METKMTFGKLIEAVCVPNEVSVLGITGQAGRGKTTRITALAGEEIKRRGFGVAELGLDAFFRLSSRGRKTWIAEGFALSPEEGAFRADQINWWDFGKAQKSLYQLLLGEPLHLTGVYNRADGGELTGEVHIVPPREGLAVLFEGVAICHLDGINELLFTHAQARVRLERLRQRDAHRQGTEVLERFRVTQSFERGYFPKHWHRITRFVDNSVDYPEILPPLECKHALAEEGID